MAPHFGESEHTVNSDEVLETDICAYKTYEVRIQRSTLISLTSSKVDLLE